LAVELTHSGGVAKVFNKVLAQNEAAVEYQGRVYSKERGKLGILKNNNSRS